jgi:glycosyltransferase involved in cell wall biosynthesis
MRVDIILPVYRPVQDYLTKAVDSIANQAYRDWCLYIVDDASPDDSFQWVQKQFGDLPRIHTESLVKNHRAAAVRNYAVTIGRGAIITFIDQDDFWHRDKLQRYVDFLQRYPEIQVVHSDIEWVDAGGKVMAGKADKENGIRRRIPYSEYRSSQMVKELFRRYSIRIGTMAVRRITWEEVGGYNPRLFGGEDQDLVLRLADDFRLAHIPGALTFRRYHSQQVTRQYRKRREWGKIRFYFRVLFRYPATWKFVFAKIGRSLKGLIVADDGR